MKRRQFGATVGASLGAGLGTSLALGSLSPLMASSAHSQGSAPIEGTDYVKLSKPLAVPPGKIEVVEFFWYGCPHCNAFEPSVEAWSARLPKDVAFRRVPVAFREEPFVPHQKIFYALEAINQIDQMHKKVFAAIHVDHKRMDKPDEIGAFMEKNGVDQKKFLDAYNSFGVAAKARQATKIAEDFQVDGVPCIGVQGRYMTSGTLAGTLDRSLLVTDFLLDKTRKGA